MWNVRTMTVTAIFVRVPVRCEVMRDVFVNWSNVLAGFVPWTITRRETHSVVLGESLVVS